MLTNFTLQKVIDEQPEMVAAWNEALAAALAYASENEDAVRSAIATNLDIPEAGAAGIVLPEFTADLSNAGLEDLVALAMKFKYFEVEPDLGAIVVQ